MQSLSLLKPYFQRNRHLIAAGFVCLIIVDGMQLFIPRVIKRAVDDLTVLAADAADLLRYALYLAAIGVFVGIFRYLWRRFLLGTSRKVEEGLRNRLFSHILTLSPSYFDRTKTGDLMALATNDIQQIRMATGMGLVAVNDAIVMGTAAIGFMAYINLRLTLYVLIPMPCIVIGTRILGRKMHRRYKAVQASFADLTESVRERLAGIRIIKAYNRERNEAAGIRSASRRYVDHNLRLVKITGGFFPLMMLFTNTSLAIVLYLGGRHTILQQITAGDFVAFISYLNLLTWPMMALGWVTNLIQRGRASLDRIHHILQTAPAIKDAPDAVRLEKIEGWIRFAQVGFRYTATGPAALSKIDLNVAPGGVLGIVGPPGSGKSTLLNLIPRLYDATEGRIRLDGRDLRELRLADVRRGIAAVPQEPFVFAGSIADNICLGAGGGDQAPLIAAAEKALIYDTVQSLPRGFDTLVGEKGVTLSGGQKQRLALARAFYSDRPLLILDDPISQVDADTGRRMIAAIRAMRGRKTIVISSHRLSAVSWADDIISLENGRIVESGTHAALMAGDHYYARTFRLQETVDHAS